MDSFQIKLENIGKRFYGRWLFRESQMCWKSGDSAALIGTNGCGKSTLLRVIAGQLAATEGRVHYTHQEKKIAVEQIYQHLSWSSPAMSLYSDLTLEEHLKLHFQFKKCILADKAEIMAILRLENEADKKLRFYSSGMLQRVKVGLALFSESKMLLLDEPTSNMDEDNALYMMQLIHQYQENRVLIIASNLEREYHSLKEKWRMKEGRWLQNVQ